MRSPYPHPLEHLAFGVAAGLLGAALWLEVQASTGSETFGRRKALTRSLQAIGIGSLLPLSGFLLLLLANLVISAAMRERQASDVEEPSVSRSHALLRVFVEHVAFAALSCQWLSSASC